MQMLQKNSWLPGILFSMLIFGCAQTQSASREPVSREEIVQNLSPIVKVEERGRKLTMVMQQLPLVVDINEEDVQKLKEHYDVFYVYHNAATISLAEGKFEAYRDHLKVASNELDSIEQKLKNVAAKSDRRRMQ
ncbi:MAG TPA: hypothetical protein VFU31_05860 [Candidatus Binatia bacterium]|nr:hypothetical protein [Candidatus Binatia bacterium]